MIKAKYVLWLGTAWLVAYLGCGSSTSKATARPAKPDSVIAGAICETMPQPGPAAPEPVPAPVKPAPEPAAKPAAPAARQPVAQPAGESAKPVASAPKQLPRMWDFGSETCIPCKTMMEILTPMIAEYAGKVDIRIINVYQQQQLAAQNRIQIIPTQIFYDREGKELFRHVGVFPRDSILSRFREYGFVPAR